MVQGNHFILIFGGDNPVLSNFSIQFLLDVFKFNTQNIII